VPAYRAQKEMPYPAEETLYPEGLEPVPPRFAILHRNKWMLDNTDYVVTFVTTSVGGAAFEKREAERKKRIVLELAQNG
jgi:hypothetical protein